MGDQPGRTRYRIDVTAAASAPSTDAGTPIGRQPEPGDRDALAALMLDAYRGTIDDEGETLADAVEVVDDWLADAPLLAHSRVVDGADGITSAVLAMTVGDGPFIAFAMTAAASKGTGLGRALVDEVLDSLAGAGHRWVDFVITDGNVASERLFGGAGAVPAPVSDG